ncbi:antibiotic biosynthesis monooxygenase (plasmid) [Sinorhizobium meliloti]|nr:antibiotic biosynthesis monooxygenase [Sinorhizobium meliloti]
MITPGNEDAFETYAAELSVATRTEAGCLSYHLHRHLNQKGVYVFVEDRPPARYGNSTCPAKPSAPSTGNCPPERSPTSRSPPRTDRLRRQKA